MTIPINICLWNHHTGEIYAEKVVDNFTTTQFEHKEILYRWIDCQLRAIDKGENNVVLTIRANTYPKDPTIF